MKIRYIIFLFLAVMLTGCFSDFEPDIESKPVVCINANAKVGETLDIFVTRTWRWSEYRTSEDRFTNNDISLKDAAVTLYVNDEVYAENIPFSEWTDDELWWGEEKKMLGYRTDYVPQCGDKIRIVAVSKDYGSAEGETIVPFAVDIDRIKIKSDITEIDYTGAICYTGEASLEVFFTDPDDDMNYYMFEASLNNDSNYPFYSTGYFDFEMEPLFTEHVSPLESIVSETYGYTLFSDRMIQGKQYPLHIRLEGIYYTIKKDDKIDDNQSNVALTLYSLSESYYKHVISVWQSEDGVTGALGGVGLADQVWKCSNVSTGAGVISAIAPSTIRVPLSRIVSE
ncbi:MAG: DUF4249 domain-containing protein [Muribaculaceae bacterium]|nr:DUF4249 domain-containing protein [Muribaculaceae bacterium]